MEPRQAYLDRLAEIDARVGAVRADPAVVIERAAGMVAGRVGCRVEEARAHLSQLAAEQGRDRHELAAEVLAALEPLTPSQPRRMRATVERALHAPPVPPVPRAPTTRPAPTDGADGQRAGGDRTGADWVDAVQHVLDAMPGKHSLLLPVRDDAGAVVDYVFAAASPSVTDLSGRRGPDLIGRRAAEIYPAVTDGPVWSAWRDALVDGLPREVGPFPYVGQAADSSPEVVLTVRVQPVGGGLLNTWVRHDEDTRRAERIVQTERLGNLGWGEWDLITDTVEWSEELYRIYERDPADGPLPRGESDRLTLPEDRPVLAAAAAAFGRGETVDVTYRIRINDRIKHVRTVADAVRDLNGRPLKVYGIIQDVTARETSRSKLVEVERQLAEHRQSLAAEHRLAAQLQQIILPIPTGPIELPGMRAAVRYVPAEQASRVGGDWYHAAPASDGSVVLAVGDVAGHGIPAAAAMARLRHTLAALAVTTTTDPAELLAHLNRLIHTGDDDFATATAVVARYRPDTGELRWAQAGHPAPLLARAGRTGELPRPAGPLLGAIDPARYETAEVTLRQGDLLLLYTDGLVEERSRTLADGLAPVIAALDEVSAGGAAEPLGDVLSRLRRANPGDDTCVLAAEATPGGG
jgi:serine phosphatase RsbU (regulator of sigma subunit)